MLGYEKRDLINIKVWWKFQKLSEKKNLLNNGICTICGKRTLKIELNKRNNIPEKINTTNSIKW